MTSCRWVCLIVLFFLLSGCSTPESRAKDNPAGFKKLSAKQKAIVLEGQIEKGMSKDAVQIAFGKPNRVRKSDGAERWIYTKPEYYDIPHWRYETVRSSNGRLLTIPQYDPLQMRRDVDAMEVTFRNGKVVAWREL
jgi:outer membrane protein assembly factor BamE (lipoprotein component of BamABCDE complex)